MLHASVESDGANTIGLVLADILPKDMKSYDKNRPPKYMGQPTIVYFHVTVLSIDTINEESMVKINVSTLVHSCRHMSSLVDALHFFTHSLSFDAIN